VRVILNVVVKVVRNVQKENKNDKNGTSYIFTNIKKIFEYRADLDREL